MNIHEVRRMAEAHPKAKNFPDLDKVGGMLGWGAHGTVYKYGERKAIKFGSKWATDKRYKKLKKFIKKTKRYKAVVNVYDCGRVGEEMYWIIMEYLPKPLSSKERCGHIYTLKGYMMRSWYKGGKNWSHDKAYDLKRLPKRWQTLARSMRRIKERHIDMHTGNILKNKKGEPKMIDIESFVWNR